MSNLPTNHSNEWMPSLEVRKSHREWIAGRVLTLLNHYWREDDPVEMSAAIARDWADVLEGLPQEYIQKAAIRFQQQSGNRKPTPAAIYAMARDLMPPPTVVASRPPPPEPQRDRVSAERAEEIMNEIGFRPKRFNGGFDDAE